ncbi:PEGA domain-containing protein [candidate division WOR-3 bacterium]|nr:PEGA domain-containing protein [candidate division WOR-3 bacterium]
MTRRMPRVMLVLVVLAVAASLVLAAKTCPDCGAANKDSDKFCKKCGARLPDAPPPRRPTTPRVSGSAKVTGGVVRITSDPTGAGVSVDGRDRGRTPLELSDLGPGRHEYELTRRGFRTFYGEFAISGKLGSIVVTTDPAGAEVLLDDRPKGTAPDSGLTIAGIPYGRHTITARLGGYQDVVKTIDLKSAGPVGVTCRLGYGKGWLVVESDPPGAGLSVNDTAAGKTPCTRELEPALYALSLRRPGCYDWIGDARVQFSESTMVRVVMDRMETRKWPLLLAAVAGIGTGVAAAVRGESEYKKYVAATTPPDAVKYRRSTTQWDIGRDVAFAAGLVLGGAYFVVKW